MDESDLVAIEEIRQLKARYFRLLDTKQWREWRALFTDDCVLPAYPEKTVDEFVAQLAAERETAVTVHQGHTSEIAILSADHARAIWSMFDYVEFADVAASGRAAGHRGFTGFGHYEDEYRRVGALWRISSLRLTRLRVDAIPVEPPPPIAGYAASRGSKWALVFADA